VLKNLENKLFNWIEKKIGYKQVKYLSGTKEAPSTYINDKHERAMKAKINGEEKQTK
jgi:hypothetical protein